MSIYNDGNISEVYYCDAGVLVPISEIYNGSDLVYQTMPYTPGTVLFSDGNKTNLTFSITLKKGKYRIKLVGAGDGASNGYFYWPAGGRGSLIDCIIYIPTTTDLYAVCGNGAGMGGNGQSSVLYLNNQAAITCPSGGAITIDNNVVNIQQILSQDNGGGGGGSGSNPTALSPWGDGGYTHSGNGRGGGFYLEYTGK